jgi:hypothetical protein
MKKILYIGMALLIMVALVGGASAKGFINTQTNTVGITGFNGASPTITQTQQASAIGLPTDNLGAYQGQTATASFSIPIGYNVVGEQQQQVQVDSSTTATGTGTQEAIISA